MRKIYCISGLGADHSLFQKLFIEGYEFVALPWVSWDKKDTMATYAAKMAAEIKDKHVVILGLSFGGMLATEIAKNHPAWQIFIVSSAKKSAELGYQSPLLQWISRSEIIPSFFLARPNFVSLSLLGVKTAEEKLLIRNVMRHSDPEFYRWSINAILHWSNAEVPGNVTHIHGTNDRVILSKHVHPDHWIEGGTHIMIFNRAGEVSKIISDCLSS